MISLTGPDTDSTRRRDMVTIMSAIKKGWDIPQEVLRRVLAEATEIIVNKDRKYSDRDRLRAMELIRTMHGQDLDHATAEAKAAGVSAEELLKIMHQSTAPEQAPESGS